MATVPITSCMSNAFNNCNFVDLEKNLKQFGITIVAKLGEVLSGEEAQAGTENLNKKSQDG